MSWRRTVWIVVGIVLMMLGLLWILQGADVVRIRPILCIANCQPITGGSVGWLIAGIVTLLVGVAMVLPRRRRA